MDISNFDTRNVENMESLFDECRSLTSLDLSKFNTNNVVNMNYIFANCYNLAYLDISNFNSTKASIMDIFDNSTKLKNIISKDEKICEAKPEGSKCLPN